MRNAVESSETVRRNDHEERSTNRYKCVGTKTSSSMLMNFTLKSYRRSQYQGHAQAQQNCWEVDHNLSPFVAYTKHSNFPR
jgi:hypothetical protein